MSMAQGKRELSELRPCIRQLAARPGAESRATTYYPMHGDDDEDEWSDTDPRWDHIDESYWEGHPNDGHEYDDEDEEEQEYATSDEDSDNGKWVLLEAEELVVFQNASATILEEDMTKELEVYYLGRQAKKRSFTSNFGKASFVEILKKLVENLPIGSSIANFGINVRGQQALKVRATQKVNAEKVNGLRVSRNKQNVFPLVKIVLQKHESGYTLTR